MRTVFVILLASSLFVAGCSLFGNYDVEGLPCDPSARRGEECLPDAGFICVRLDGGAGSCVRMKEVSGF
ncbi:MAG: hypothetical protein Q8S33_23100 [Myxococcales bacterium]|nr:hypothetical protein [Myxococcales bacterium]